MKFEVRVSTKARDEVQAAAIVTQRKSLTPSLLSMTKRAGEYMLESAARLAIIRKILWDYDIAPEACLAVLDSRQPTAWHYNAQILFIKVLESFPFYAVVDLMPIDRIKELLTTETIDKLRVQQLKTRYEFIRARL